MAASNRIRIAALCLASMISIGNCQGFINLNFESARIIPIVGSPYYPYLVATSNALPGWTAQLGTNQTAWVTYNDPSVGSTWVSLEATNGQQLHGKYSVLLQGGITASAASITQTGFIPISARSLVFDGQRWTAGAADSLVVSLGGQDIPFFAVSNAPNYVVYAGDISAFAGSTQPLTFSVLEGGGNAWNLDNIQFSSAPVPEPSVARFLGLLLLGAVNLVLRRWLKCRIPR